MSVPASVRIEALLAHRGWVRALAGALVADESQADDLAQQVWLEAIERPPSHDGALRAWFAKIVRRRARDAWRESERRGQRESVSAARGSSPSAASVVAEADAHRRVVQAVMELDEPYRATVLLRFFEDLPPREIAEHMGVPVETVKTRLKRGMAKLREQLESDRDDWRAGLLPLLALRRPTPPPLVPIAGAVAMSAKKITLVAIALLLLLGAVGVVGMRSWSSRTTPHTSESAAVTETPPVRPKRTRADAPPPESPLASADASDIDRDRDVHGVVVDGDDRPVAGARVALRLLPWNRIATMENQQDRVPWSTGPETRSAADGTFKLRLREGEVAHLEASAPGLARTDVCQVQAGERLRVVLRSGVRLVARFLDPDGRPVEGVRLRVFGNEANEPVDFPSEGPSDARGICIVDSLPPGADLRHEVVHPEFVKPWGARLTLPAAGTFEKDIVLMRAPHVRGRVTDAATGSPVAGARVAARLNDELCVMTDADGQFDFRGWDGARISVSAAGYGVIYATLPSGVTDPVEFVLERGVSITGRVVDSQGAAMPAARVSAVGLPKGTMMRQPSAGGADTDAEGRFQIVDLRQGLPHLVMVQARGFGRTLLDVESAPAGGVIDLGDVPLPQRRTIAGVAVGPDGAPLARRSVTLVGENADRARRRSPTPAIESTYPGRAETRVTDDLGRFRFSDLSAGEYEVRVSSSNGQNVRRDLVLEPDRDLADLRLSIAPEFELRVHAQDVSGAAVGGAGVWVTLVSGEVLAGSAGSDGTASFTVDDAVRSVAAAARPDSMGTKPGPPAPALLRAEVTDVGDARDVTIVLPPASSTSGRLLDPDGRPIQAAALEVLQSDRVVARLRTDASGAFRGAVPATSAFTISFTGMTVPNGVVADLPLTGRWPNLTAGTNDLELRAERAPFDRALVVVALAPDGSPVPGVQIEVWAHAATPVARGGTDGTGRIRFEALPRAALRVAIAADSRNAVARALPPRECAPTAEDTEVTLGFVPAYEVTGTVFDPGGRAVPGSVVELRRGRLMVERATTDADGRFRALVPAEPPGALELTASKGRPDGTSLRARQSVTAPADVRVQLQE